MAPYVQMCLFVHETDLKNFSLFTVKYTFQDDEFKHPFQPFFHLRYLIKEELLRNRIKL